MQLACMADPTNSINQLYGVTLHVPSSSSRELCMKIPQAHHIKALDEHQNKLPKYAMGKLSKERPSSCGAGFDCLGRCFRWRGYRDPKIPLNVRRPQTSLAKRVTHVFVRIAHFSAYHPSWFRSSWTVASVFGRYIVVSHHQHKPIKETRIIMASHSYKQRVTVRASNLGAHRSWPGRTMRWIIRFLSKIFCRWGKPSISTSQQPRSLIFPKSLPQWSKRMPYWHQWTRSSCDDPGPRWMPCVPEPVLSLWVSEKSMLLRPYQLVGKLMTHQPSAWWPHWSDWRENSFQDHMDRPNLTEDRWPQILI